MCSSAQPVSGSALEARLMSLEAKLVASEHSHAQGDTSSSRDVMSRVMKIESMVGAPGEMPGGCLVRQYAGQPA